MTDHANTVPGGPAGPPRTRAIAEMPALAELAATLLRTRSALAEMGADEARCVVSYMRLLNFATRTPVFREGDASNTSYLLLVLTGDIRVEAAELDDGDTLDISVLGPGNVIGEMGLIDGAPRSATCTAMSTVQAAGLSRKALDLMLVEHPQVAAKLMVALSTRMADRLRAMGEQLGIYARLAGEMRRELDQLKAARPPSK